MAAGAAGGMAGGGSSTGFEGDKDMKFLIWIGMQI